MRHNRRTQAQIFLDKLTALSKEGTSSVSNKALREALGWKEDRYNRVKSSLLKQKEIIRRKGYGGSVALATTAETALTMFISYAHADEAIKNELLKHLGPLRHLKLVKTWDDREIKAGDKWDTEIARQLVSSQIILLLVSSDFINSVYCYEKELKVALERQETENTRVVPVIVRSCLWNHTPIAHLQVLPKDAKPIASWDNQDEALTDVAEGLRKIALEFAESE
jgi:hypothetical protein